MPRPLCIFHFAPSAISYKLPTVISKTISQSNTSRGLFGGILAHANLYGTSYSTMCALEIARSIGRMTSSVTHMHITSRLVKHDKDKIERCSTSLKQCLDSYSSIACMLQKLKG